MAVGIDVTPEQLKAQPPGENWLSYNGDFSGRRYSGLSQITPENVSRLRAQWVFHSENSERLEVTPVVVDGVTVRSRSIGGISVADGTRYCVMFPEIRLPDSSYSASS